MSNRIDSQIDDINALINEMEMHRRRKRMEAEFGPVKTVNQRPPIPIRTIDWYACFENYLDVDMPGWAHANGTTEAEALGNLLEQAEEHHAEMLDSKYQGELQRRAGCHD